MNQGSRSLLWRAHAETLVVRLDGVTETTLRGVFRRVLAEGNSADGQGMIGYTGQAKFVVRKEDLPTMPGPRAEFDRNGETWYIRHPESVDEWTWQLHLSRRKADQRAPNR
jgi:hypothetical protein